MGPSVRPIRLVQTRAKNSSMDNSVNFFFLCRGNPKRLNGINSSGRLRVQVSGNHAAFEHFVRDGRCYFVEKGLAHFGIFLEFG